MKTSLNWLAWLAMLLDNLLSVGQIELIAGRKNGQKCPKYVKNVQNHQMVGRCPTVQLSDSAVSDCPLVEQCMSKCPIVGQYCVKMSNDRTVLCPTVQWSDSVVSNCPMVGQCCVQLSNGGTVLYPTVQWSDSAVSNCQMV